MLDGGLADLVGDTSAEYNQLRFGQSWGTVTSLTQGPDGLLYAVNTSGRVYRIVVPEPTIPFIALFAAMFSVLPRQFRTKRRRVLNGINARHRLRHFSQEFELPRIRNGCRHMRSAERRNQRCSARAVRSPSLTGGDLISSSNFAIKSRRAERFIEFVPTLSLLRNSASKG